MAIDWKGITILGSVEFASGREFAFTQPRNPEHPDRGGAVSASFGKPLSGYSEPIFLLSLYSVAFFTVKEALSIDPNWKVTRRQVSPQTKASNSKEYKITEDEWPRFEGFIRMCEKARTQTYTQKSRAIEVAKRHYLTATFAPMDSLAQWELLGRSTSDLLTFENILFHYISAIEALLSPGNELKSAIAEHAKDLAGRNNEERNWIRRFFTRGYKIRNSLAHGGEIEGRDLTFDLLKLRRLTQRIICLALGMFVYTDSATAGFALQHMDEHLSQERAAVVRNEVYKLIQDNSALGGNTNIETV